jgi:hypothetical protein
LKNNYIIHFYPFIYFFLIKKIYIYNKMSANTTLCANVMCANSGKMNNLVIETSANSSSTTSLLKLTNTYSTTAADASAAVLELNNNPSTANADDGDDLGVIQFTGIDSAGNATTYASILAESSAVATTSEEGSLKFNLATTTSGASETVLTLQGGVSAATSTTTIAGSTRIAGELALTQSVATVTPVAAATPAHGAYNAGATISTTSSIVTATGGANTQIYLPSPTSVPDGKVYVIINTTTGNAIELGSLGDASTATTINNVAVTAANGNYAAEVELAAKSTFLAVKVGANAWGLIGHTAADADA